MRVVHAMIAMGALAWPVGAADAQLRPVPRHEGFWISVGAGGGWLTQQGAADESVAGGGLYVRLGGTPNEKFLLGGEIIVWARAKDDVTDSRGNATLTLLYYPKRGGLFFKGGVGTASATIETEPTGFTTVTETHSGLGTTVGAGLDFKLARNFYLTPNVDLLFQRIEGMEYTVLMLSVGGTWH